MADLELQPGAVPEPRPLHDPRPLYIELCGVAGVGKSTLASHLRRSMPDRRFFRRDRRQESGLRLLRQKDGPADRSRAFRDLFRYILIERRAIFVSAWRRARFIVGVPARRDWLGSGHVLLLDEGPLTYLVTLGGYGPAWAGWWRILVPDPREIHAVFIFLAGSPAVVDERVARRARPHKFRVGRTGKEGITREHRMEGQRFWYKRLRAEGVDALWLETDDLEPEEVHARVRAYLGRVRPDLAAAGSGAND